MTAFAAWTAVAFMLFAGNPAIELENGRVRLTGVAVGSEPAGGWQSVFPVVAGTGDLPPMLGMYSTESGALIFKPRFPLAAGVPIRAEYKPLKLTRIFESTHTAPSPSTHVLQAFPSGSSIPENQLKFYITFSAPMSRGDIWQHIKLLREDGTAVDLPFLEIEQELWDRDHRRLTVLFDPGRIKRGVLPLTESGPAIEEGKQYTLEISEKWHDAQGVPLKQKFRKMFRVTAADRTPLDPATWQLSSPKAGTSDPLVLKFPEPVDYAMAQHAIRVPSVEGTVALHDNEREWRFTPSTPWKADSYKVVVDTRLEDLAGNRVGRAFDVDVFERVTRTIQSNTVELPFRVSLEQR